MNYSDYIKKGATPFQKNFISLLKNEKLQKYYAEQLGVSPQNFNNWVRGNAVPDADKLAKIARCFNVSVDWLLGISDARTINTGVSDFCKYTGLNESAVEALHIANITNGKIGKVFSEMLEGGELWTICGLIGNTSDYIRDNINEIKSLDVSINEIKLKQAINKDITLMQDELDILNEKRTKLEKELEFEKWQVLKRTESMITDLIMSLSKKCDISDLDESDILEIIEQYESAAVSVDEIIEEIKKAPSKDLEELLERMLAYRLQDREDAARIIRLHKPEYFNK